MRIITRKTVSIVIVIMLTLALGVSGVLAANKAPNTYQTKADTIINSLRNTHNSSLAQAISGRAIWYMEYGYMKYGHTTYATTGYIDCSQFVSRVYKDFGFTVTSASRNYDRVGVKVSGVYFKRSSNGKYTLVGIEKLRPGDIFTFWKVTPQLGGHIGHVGMYLGQVNGKPCVIMTTPGFPTAIGIVDNFSNWYGATFHNVRRVLPNSAYVPGGVIRDREPVIPSVYRIKRIAPIIMPQKLPAGF